jgi:UDP-N-acetylmuramyl pentapeptide phosphotransferase/UDP-N-acetylglucosamine-1-phosphate transferase
VSTLIVVVLAVAAFIVSAGFTRHFCNPGSIVYVLDHPNARSLHDRPVPRGGGLAILVAVFVCGVAVAWLYPAPGLAGIAAGIIVVAVVSFLDDRYSVPPPYRLLAHTAAAVVILFSGYVLKSFEIAGTSLDWPLAVGAGFSFLFVVWTINLYNFMDGMDGFAGGMAMFGFGALAAMGWMAGHDLFLAVNLIVAAAAAGFLVFNFPPARIFLGDVGSSTLGSLAAALSLWGARDGVFPFWIAVLVFSPFIVDATVTLARRALRGERVWQAHKTHYYQRLVQLGWGHRRTVLVEYGLMAACALSAVLAVGRTPAVQWSAIAAWTIAYLALGVGVARLEAGRRPSSADF